MSMNPYANHNFLSSTRLLIKKNSDASTLDIKNLEYDSHRSPELWGAFLQVFQLPVTVWPPRKKQL